MRNAHIAGCKIGCLRKFEQVTTQVTTRLQVLNFLTKSGNPRAIQFLRSWARLCSSLLPASSPLPRVSASSETSYRSQALVAAAKQWRRDTGTWQTLRLASTARASRRWLRRTSRCATPALLVLLQAHASAPIVLDALRPNRLRNTSVRHLVILEQAVPTAHLRLSCRCNLAQVAPSDQTYRPEFCIAFNMTSQYITNE